MDKRDLYRLLDLANAVSSKHVQVDELTNGYAFAFPDAGRWRRKLDDFCKLFGHSGKGITATMVPEPEAERLWLRFEGPDGTKPYVKTLLLSGTKYPSRVKMELLWKARGLTTPLRMLPTHLIIGAARCGTTSLYNYLIQHPSIQPATKKEIFFFDGNFHLGLQHYRTHFTMRWKRPIRRNQGRSLHSARCAPSSEYLRPTRSHWIATTP